MGHLRDTEIFAEAAMLYRLEKEVGMEVPQVVFAIDNSHFTLLERQLVYTGVTRAKKLLIIVGSKRALDIAAKRAQTKRRCTLLLERISSILLPENKGDATLFAPPLRRFSRLSPADTGKG
jgi:exodeoxyribonuclease V alpha subunit